MAKTYHKSTTDDGGAIGDEITQSVNKLFSEVTLAQQSVGITISRKFYISNSGADDILISNLSLDDFTIFDAILFESSGDTQVVGDLTGSETDESPITATIPASGHKSFWIQIDVPTGSTKTENYGTASTKSIH